MSKVHQKNFVKLKTELGKVQKRPVFLANGTASKELEYQLLNFDPDDKGKTTKILKVHKKR